MTDEVTITKQSNGDFNLKITDGFTEVHYEMDRDQAQQLRDEIVYELKKESDQGVRVR